MPSPPPAPLRLVVLTRLVALGVLVKQASLITKPMAAVVVVLALQAALVVMVVLVEGVSRLSQLAVSGDLRTEAMAVMAALLNKEAGLDLAAAAAAVAVRVLSLLQPVLMQY